MKNATRKYKFNIPQIVVVENMVNQISRKNCFIVQFTVLYDTLSSFDLFPRT